MQLDLDLRATLRSGKRRFDLQVQCNSTSQRIASGKANAQIRFCRIDIPLRCACSESSACSSGSGLCE